MSSIKLFLIQYVLLSYLCDLSEYLCKSNLDLLQQAVLDWAYLKAAHVNYSANKTPRKSLSVLKMEIGIVNELWKKIQTWSSISTLFLSNNSWQLWVPSTISVTPFCRQKAATAWRGRIRPLWLEVSSTKRMSNFRHLNDSANPSTITLASSSVRALDSPPIKYIEIFTLYETFTV